MNNCYNCKNLTIERHTRDTKYLVSYHLDCKHCDMRIKNHATPCIWHEEGDPILIRRD